MNSALLVIDVQRALFEPEPQPFEAERVIERINILARAARHAGQPVVFIQHERTDTALAHGTAGWELANGLEFHDTDEFVRKTTPDSFLRTNLQEVLERRQISQVVVSGYACEFCVDTTVRRAAALGYLVIVAADAHTTHDKPHASAAMIRAHENATLPDITSFGPKITAMPSAEIFFAAPQDSEPQRRTQPSPSGTG